MHEDPVVKRILRKYGLEGYGLYCIVLELITLRVTTASPVPELEETPEDIAYFFHLDGAKVVEMMAYFVSNGLLEINEATERFECKKIYKYFQQSFTSSPAIRELIKSYAIVQANGNPGVMINHDKS